MNKELAIIAMLQGHYVTLNGDLLYSYSDSVFCVTNTAKCEGLLFDINNLPKSDNMYKIVKIHTEKH